jgi:hypothetical protein
MLDIACANDVLLKAISAMDSQRQEDFAIFLKIEIDRFMAFI